jgi:hypothetical protein
MSTWKTYLPPSEPGWQPASLTTWSMRARPLYTDIQNALDFLLLSELALYANPVSLSPTRLGWHTPTPGAAFLLSYGSATVAQYLEWVRHGVYSAVLRDGGLLQISYDVRDEAVVGHRLAYVPCPVDVDQELLDEGEPLEDVVSLLLTAGTQTIAMRTPLRFDFDAAAARPGHPAAHFSLNSADCRVACVAPLHPYRFVDFVFQHFYPRYRRVHEAWFDSAGRRRLGSRVITDDERQKVHVSWPCS